MNLLNKNWRGWPVQVKLQLLHRLQQMHPTRTQGRTREVTLELIRADPTQTMRLAGMHPDSWQTDLLTCDAQRVLMLCSRQSGKSQVAAALALNQALLHPDSLILVLSKSLRQSGEFFRDKFMRLYRATGAPVPARGRPTALTIELENGSRVISLPGEGDTIVGYSGVAMLIIDEAARVPDNLYRMVRPMLAVKRGKLVCLSTPYGRRGFFHEEWESKKRTWKRVKATALDCPRIPKAFLQDERDSLGERWYRQEYECSFEDVEDAVFRSEDIDAALQSDLEAMEI